MLNDDVFDDWQLRNGTGSTTLWTAAYTAPRFAGQTPTFRQVNIDDQAQLARERKLARAYVRQEKSRRELQDALDKLTKSSREEAAKAERSRELAAQLASDSLHGVQPRNNHHRSLRGFSDAPRRPVYRGSR